METRCQGCHRTWSTDTPCPQSKMLHITGLPSYSVTLSNGSFSVTGIHFASKDMVRLMMNKIFQSIETELNSLIALGDKIDSFNSLYMLVKMSHHVWTAENVDPASYLSTTLGNVLVTVKRNFDKCIVRLSVRLVSKLLRILSGFSMSLLSPQSGQIRQMEEVKISKKSKVGILSFVTGFEEFAELAETIFRNAERRGDLDKAYVKLIRAVFMNGETRDPKRRRKTG